MIWYCTGACWDACTAASAQLTSHQSNTSDSCAACRLLCWSSSVVNRSVMCWRRLIRCLEKYSEQLSKRYCIQCPIGNTPRSLDRSYQQTFEVNSRYLPLLLSVQLSVRLWWEIVRKSVNSFIFALSQLCRLYLLLLWLVWFWKLSL